MSERKKIPIGIEDFKEIIERECYFVDKSLMIQDLLDSGAKVTLFTRPRRFGKTLNMSMLRYFFEKSEQDNSYLFNNLAVSKAGEKYFSHMGQYPVISISLKGMKQGSYELAFLQFKNIIIEEFGRHRELLKSDKLTSAQIGMFTAIYDNKADDSAYFSALKLLSDCLASAYGKNVIILIDEYDVPLENAYFNGFYDEMINLIRSVFESVLKTNSSLEFAVLTGCLRISKESIFTGLNNLSVCSIMNNGYSKYFGFTEDEVIKMLDYYGKAKELPELKKWYDGYRFGTTDIYNPWSIVKFIQSTLNEEEQSFLPYWSNTSSNAIVHKLITESDITVREKIEQLMDGETLCEPIYEDTVYADIDVNSDQIWSFLLFTGYLKMVSQKNIGDILHAELVIPNTEVRTIYQRTIMQWFKEKVNADPREDLFEALLNKDCTRIEDIICDWLDETISYHDEKEQYYHGFMTGLLSGFKGYMLKSNRESGDGRPDLLLMEKRKREIAIIIEVKDTKKFSELESLCDTALAQIEENRYEAELKQESYKNIIKYGIAFCGKSCMVKMNENC